MAARQGGGKERASRIPLDYYKTSDAIARWKVGLSLLAVLFAMGWWATGFSLGGSRFLTESDAGRLRYSHGPVARVHAAWDARCEACHSAFQPIGQDAWTAKVGLSSKEADGKCRSCHAVEDHHAKTQKLNDPASVACAACHRDHQGREFSLVRLPDSDCTSCHRDLKNHTQSGASRLPNVASLVKDHPEFALVATKAKDPGTLKFNHALHMSKGLIEGKGQKPLFTLAQLTPEDRSRYAREGQKLGDGVTMECASCHHLDDGDSLSSPAINRGRGAYMQSVSYKTDCASCHKLDVGARLGEAPTTIAVPHALQPPALHAWLTNASLGLSLGKDPKLLEAFTPSNREIPGRPSKREQSARDEVESRVAKAEKILFGAGKGTCTECHHYQTPRGPAPHLEAADPIHTIAIAPPAVQARWYQKAVFDHSAHRAVSCKSCHESAYPDGESASRTSADVMIPGKASCIQCHAPASHDDRGIAIGGVGFACTECHTYHGDHQPAKDVEGMSFSRFLSGSGGKPK